MQLLPKELVKSVGATARRHDLDTLAHFFDRDAVELSGAGDKVVDERDAVVYVFCLVSFEVEGATWKVLDGGSAEEGGVEGVRIECEETIGGWCVSIAVY